MGLLTCLLLIKIMEKKNNPLSKAFGIVQKATTDAVNTAGSAGESLKNGIVSAANSVGSALNGAVNKAGGKTVRIADLNGDGKLDQEDVMIALGSIYAKEFMEGQFVIEGALNETEDETEDTVVEE